MAIYTNSVMNSVFTTLSSDSTLVNCGVVIEQYAILNTNPHNTLYWLNILDPEITIDGARANITTPWKQIIQVTIQCQVQNYENIEQQFGPMQELNDLRDNVFSAVNSNRTLDDTVLMVTNFQLSPLNRDQIQSDDFLESQLVLTAEAWA